MSGSVLEMPWVIIYNESGKIFFEMSLEFADNFKILKGEKGCLEIHREERLTDMCRIMWFLIWRRRESAA